MQASPSDDMDDSVEIAELKKYPGSDRLLRILNCCSKVIEPEFRRADAEVGRCQAAYMRLANWAAWLGAFAVLFAILQLSELTNSLFAARVLPWVEFGLAAAAVIVALIGLGGRRQQKWFLARYRAERLRLLKYDLMTRSASWSDDPEASEKCCQDVAGEVEETMASSFTTLEYWMTQGTLPEVVIAPSLQKEEWIQLREYYRRRRLLEQISYLARASERNWQRNDRTRTWPSVLFFGSVAFVLAHFFVELVGWHTGNGGGAIVGKTALLLAASLPVCGAGVRVLRGVFEYGRNASRYEATHNVLAKLNKRLREADDPSAVLREIGFCEQVLESDLRDWLRLMVEAEWFG